MEFIDFEWPNGIRDKVIRKHGLDPEEVEDSFFEAGARVERAKYSRYVVWTQTAAGAYILVVFEYQKGVATIITARQMTAGERRHYLER